MSWALLFAMSVGASVFAASRPASALGPVDIEIAARVGGGTNPIKDDPINILGASLGGRSGISLFGIYAGITGAYYFGTGSLPAGMPLGNGAVLSRNETVSSWTYGGQVGYGFKIRMLTLRPTVEVGQYVIHVPESQDFFNIYIEPGFTALAGFGPWFIGADANVFLTPGLSGSQAAFVGAGQVGLKF